MFLLVRYSTRTMHLVVFLLVHGRVKKTRTRPWAGTGQVRLRARTSTGSARYRRLPKVELAHELELVRGLKSASGRRSHSHHQLTSLGDTRTTLDERQAHISALLT